MIDISATKCNIYIVKDISATHQYSIGKSKFCNIYNGYVVNFGCIKMERKKDGRKEEETDTSGQRRVLIGKTGKDNSWGGAVVQEPPLPFYKGGRIYVSIIHWW